MKVFLVCWFSFLRRGRVRCSSPTLVSLKNTVSGATDKCISKTEEVRGKVDDLVLNRAIRLADHASIFFMLRMLAEKAGDAPKLDVSIAPASTVPSPLAIPGWSADIWSIVAIYQLASMAKSALTDGSNDLGQRDITTLTISNMAAVRAVDGATANPLLNMAALALISGYGLLQGGADGKVNIHDAVISSLASVLTVMRFVPAVTNRIGILDGRVEVVRILAVGAYYLMANRTADSTVKNTVHAGIIGGTCGLAWPRLVLPSRRRLSCRAAWLV